MADLMIFSNDASGFLQTGIDVSATTLTLQAGQGAKFPMYSAGQYSICVLEIESAYEVIKIISRSGDVLQIQRAQEGTSAAPFPAGTLVEMRVTSGVLTYLRQLALSSQGEITPYKQPVRVVATSNITPSDLQTIAGISLSIGDRVLLSGQTNLSQNGIYSVQIGAWVRTSDFDGWGKTISALVLVSEGNAKADTVWMCTSNAGNFLMDVDPIRFIQLTGDTEAANALVSAHEAKPDPHPQYATDEALTQGLGGKLGKNETATDSAKLGGQPPEYYAKAADLAAAGSKPGRLVVTFRDTPEPGTLACNGAAISRTTYAKLFAAIGTKYGTGDGSSTFNLPNIPDGHALLAANGSAVGSTSDGEVKSHSHSASSWTDNSGAHQHVWGNNSPTGNAGIPAGIPHGDARYLNWNGGLWTRAGDGSHAHSVGTAINATGAANNLAAGMKLLVCIAYE